MTAGRSPKFFFNIKIITQRERTKRAGKRMANQQDESFGWSMPNDEDQQ